MSDSSSAFYQGDLHDCHSIDGQSLRKGGNAMEGVMRGMLLVLVILYIVSPVDLCPGPIDDILVLLLGIAAQKRAHNS